MLQVGTEIGRLGFRNARPLILIPLEGAGRAPPERKSKLMCQQSMNSSDILTSNMQFCAQGKGRSTTQNGGHWLKFTSIPQGTKAAGYSN